MKLPLKTAYIDIETKPCTGWFWSTGKTVISESQILDHTKIICICWMWDDSSEKYELHWDDNQDDKKMLEDFLEAVKDAECFVGHNEKSFDIKVLNARIAYHRLHRQLPLTLVEDTLLMARKAFRLPSFKLSYLLRYFNVKRKLHTDSKLWVDVVYEGSKKALDYMVKYCKNDCYTLKLLYHRLLPYLPSKQSYALVTEDNRICPLCKNKVSLDGFRYTTTGKKQRWHCNKCGKKGTFGSNLIQHTASYPRGD